MTSRGARIAFAALAAALLGVGAIFALRTADPTRGGTSTDGDEMPAGSLSPDAATGAHDLAAAGRAPRARVPEPKGPAAAPIATPDGTPPPGGVAPPGRSKQSADGL